MTSERAVLVRYRLERARESLAEARLLLQAGHTNTFVNRLYYACFYAASAALLAEGKSATTHSGLRTLFHQGLVKPGVVPSNWDAFTTRSSIAARRAITPTWSALMSRRCAIGCRRQNDWSNI